MRRILVAGGAGFIGSNLCHRLIQCGHTVICIDNFSSGNIQNIDSLIHNKAFQLLEQDICSPISCDVDEIYHLACPASPIHYSQDPIGTLNASFIGTQNLLRLAKNNNAKILFTSTSEIYGDPIEHPQKESYWGNVNTVGVRSCYDEGKRVAETLCYEYRKQFDVDVKIARLFNVYGPRMSIDDGRVIPSFICSALENRPIIIYGDGTQTRSFIYVDDLIDALLFLMNTNDNFCGPINIGNPQELAINAIAKIICKKIDTCSMVKYVNKRSDDPQKRKPDISLANQILDWSPNIDFDLGISKTIDYFKLMLNL